MPPFSTTTRVSGATIYIGHTWRVRYRQKIYITLRTSKPLSRLIKASCNPLSADEILSTTVPISVRCASEIAACSRRFISASGRAPDSPRLFLLLPSGAEYPGLQVAEGLPFGLGGSGEILCDDTLGSSASRGGEARGGVSLSIISGRRSPEDELCREELLARLQRMNPGYYSRRRKQ